MSVFARSSTEKKFSEQVKDIVYLRILRRVLFSSRIARKSMLGYADSGSNFEYIYQNKASGYNKLGNIIDKLLLNLPSAKATRYRMFTLSLILKDEIIRNIASGKKTRIVDLGSGLSRYLFNAISTDTKSYVEALCLDNDKNVISKGRNLAKEYPVLFARGNVFNVKGFRKLSLKKRWVPNIIIASGLYANYGESFFITSIREVFESLCPGGLFVFDWLRNNPNEQLIKRLAIARSGKPWALHYGDRAKIYALLKSSGFSAITHDLDEWGMYTIYRARRPEIN